jgi:ABC-2 type transport system ATP-binding protein
MIEVKNLTKYYGNVPAIEGVSFSVEQGEIIGFLGPNAAGKTTTMRILTGFSPPTRGTARIAGFDITVDPIEVKRRVGYLPESVPLYGEMLVSSFLSYVAEVKGIERRKRKTETGRVMELCGLSHMANRVVRNLSKGYRQRVGLAQALVGDPPVLILDEPTVGLDPQQIIEIRQMIRELGKSHTVLLSTHILPEVSMVCERVLIINKGHIVAQDTMRNLAAGDESMLELAVDGPSEQVRAAAGRVEGIGNVVTQGIGVYGVQCPVGLESELTKSIIEAGLSLRALTRRVRTLEDVFLTAISAEEGVKS